MIERPYIDPGPCTAQVAAGCTGYEKPTTPGLCTVCAVVQQEETA